MDGLLHFVVKGGNEKSKAQQALLVEGIESDTHCIFEKMRESVMPLGMWEIKSTCVSLQEVMVAVPNLGKFFWMFCDDACLMTPKYMKEQEKVVCIVVGLDAQNLP